MVSYFLLPLSLTLLIELAVALAWGLRDRDLLLCALVNLLTNPAVVLLHSLFPAWWVTLLLEGTAVVVEAAYYSLCGTQISHPRLLALSANALSFCTGLLIGRMLL